MLIILHWIMYDKYLYISSLGDQYSPFLQIPLMCILNLIHLKDRGRSFKCLTQNDRQFYMKAWKKKKFTLFASCLHELGHRSFAVELEFTPLAPSSSGFCIWSWTTLLAFLGLQLADCGISLENLIAERTSL